MAWASGFHRRELARTAEGDRCPPTIRDHSWSTIVQPQHQRTRDHWPPSFIRCAALVPTGIATTTRSVQRSACEVLLRSIRDAGLWRYAIFSGGHCSSRLGHLYCALTCRRLNIYKKDQYLYDDHLGRIATCTCCPRDGRSRVSDYTSQRIRSRSVFLGDLFKIHGEVIISTTIDIRHGHVGGLIAASSWQGQLATKYSRTTTGVVADEVSLKEQLSSTRRGRKKRIQSHRRQCGAHSRLDLVRCHT